MRGDEGELEAASEETEHEQHVAAVPECLGERLRDRLARGRRWTAGLRRVAAAGEHERERHRNEHGHGKDDERLVPAEAVDEKVRDRREEELAERARRGAGPEGERPPFRRQELAEGAEDEVERRAREAEADEHAGAEMHQPGRRRIGHDREPERVEDRPGADHAHRAEAVGDGACEGLADAPEQVLQRDRQAEDVAPPAVLGRHRDLEQPGGRPRPGGDQGDGAARRDHELGGDSARRRPGHGELPNAREAEEGSRGRQA